MKKDFEQYLINLGYKTTTPSGKPSTVYDYSKRIDRVCKEEAISWIALAQRISSIVKDYDTGGAKQWIGEESHRSVINALKRFEEYVRQI